MNRGQLNLRIKQMLSRVDNQTITVEAAAEEISLLFDEYIEENFNEEKEAIAV